MRGRVSLLHQSTDSAVPARGAHGRYSGWVGGRGWGESGSSRPGETLPAYLTPNSTLGVQRRRWRALCVLPRGSVCMCVHARARTHAHTAPLPTPQLLKSGPDDRPPLKISLVQKNGCDSTKLRLNQRRPDCLVTVTNDLMWKRQDQMCAEHRLLCTPRARRRAAGQGAPHVPSRTSRALSPGKARAWPRGHTRG